MYSRDKNKNDGGNVNRFVMFCTNTKRNRVSAFRPKQQAKTKWERFTQLSQK